MPDENKPKYVGTPAGQRPNQKNPTSSQPIVVPAVKYKKPLTPEETQAYYKMTSAEKQRLAYERIRQQNIDAFPKDPLNNIHVVNQALKNNVSIYPTLPDMGMHGYEYQQQRADRQLGFWENPQRIVRFKDYIDQHPDEVLPDWLDKETVNTAYSYLQYANNYKDSSEWGALPVDSPVSESLRNLPEPTFPNQIEQFVTDTNSLENTVNPEDLTMYQRALYGFMSPQPGKFTLGAAAQVGLSGVGTAGGTSFFLGKISNLLQAIGITKNPMAFASPFGIVAGVLFGSAAWKKLQTGKEMDAVETLKWALVPPGLYTTKFGKNLSAGIDRFFDSQPGLKEYFNKYNPLQFKYLEQGVTTAFNALSTTVAGVLGVIAQATAGDDDFQDVVKNLGAAYKSGTLSYVAYGKTKNLLLPLSGGKFLEKGKMWDISGGKSKPVDIPVGFTVEATALDELRGQIENDPDNWQKYKQDFISRFGVEGQINDFALQSFLDPLNAAPYVNAKGVELIGRKTGNVPLEYAGKMAQGNPIVDLIPFPFNGAVELISGGKLRGSKGFVGAMDAYKSFLQGNIPSNLKGKMPYVAPKDYTRTQKFIAGLTEEGLPKRMVAQDPNKNAIQVAKELSPESKALLFEYTLTDRLFYLHDLAGGDSATFLKLIDAAKQADPTLTAQKIGDIFEESGLQRDFMDYREFNSPIGAAVASGLKKAVDSGAIADIVANFDKTAQNRVNLKRYADFFGLNEAELLKRYKEGTNLDSIIRNMVDPAKVELARTLFPNGDTTALRAELDLFVKGDKKVPYSEKMLGYAIINSVTDGLDEFLKGRFGIKDNDPMWMRLSSTFKAMQSLAVLSLNPRYMLYNLINNIITRIATNNYGYANWKKFNEKYEPFVARKDIEGGLSQDIINNTSSLLMDKNKTARGYGLLENGINKAFRKINDLVGFATKGSRKIEQVESQQSFAVEYIDSYQKVHKVEIPAEVAKVLPPKVSKSLQKILEGAGKIQDIDQALSHLSDPLIPREVIDNTLSAFADANEKLRTSPDYYREILTKTGIYDEITSGLQNAKTPREVADVFDSIELHYQDYLNKLAENDLVARVSDIESKVKAEGFPAALSELTDMYILRQDTIAGKWVAMDYLFSLKGIADAETWHTMYRNQVNINNQEFARISDWQQATYDGFVKALGKQGTPEANLFLTKFKESNDLYSKFFKEKNDIWDEFGGRKFENDAAYQKAYAETKAKVEQMYADVQARDFDIQADIDKSMVALSGLDPKVIVWRGELGKIRMEIAKSMSDFRASLDQFDPPLNAQQRNALYNKYITEDYLAMQTRMKDIEVGGAHEIFNDKRANTPIIEQQIADLEARIAEIQKAQPTTITKEWLNGRYYELAPTDEMQLPFLESALKSLDYARLQLIADYHSITENSALWLIKNMEVGNPSGVGLVRRIFDYAKTIPDSVFEAARTKFAGNEYLKEIIDGAEKRLRQGGAVSSNPELAAAQQQLGLLKQQLGEASKQPLGTTPSVPNQSITATQGGYLFLTSLLNGIKANALDALNNPKAKVGIPQEAMPMIKKFLAKVKQDTASDKYFAQSWGESQRDFVMLNYTKKTNFDNALSFIFPYQFWYTNTMRNWALRMIDRPAIFNQYFRYRQAQENMERSGIPARLEGKMSAFAPWLPEWMGDTLWSDPMGQLYPFSQALQPFNKIIGLQDDLTTSAGYALNDMVKAGKISKAEAEQAKQSMSGPIWDQAMAKATDESALSDPSSIVSLMMQPGMQWDILAKLATGHPEKIMPTPAMKTGQAIETMVNKIPGVNVNALSWLETNARKAIGMSESVAKYGQFGDYYVERMLSNMAFEGTITAQEAKQAMISHQGLAWQQADKRVAEELALKTPGVLPVEAALNGANFWQVTTSTFQSLFPQGLLPQGELIYKGQQQEYNLAYDRYKKGDKSALTEFYNDHPEYETRSALYTKDPEARLKQYIIGDIWDTFSGSSKLNKNLITDTLGDDFEKRFLQGTSDTQSMIPLETLMIWSKTIGNTVPKPEALPDFSAPEEVQNLDLWSENVTTAYDQFIKEREALYPLYYGLQNAYFELDKSEQKRFLAANPSLKQYWEWKDQYETDHPELAPVFASQQQVDVSKNPDVTLKDLDPTLVKQLNEYYSTGSQLSSGAWELLALEWQNAGRPYGTLKKWMSKVVEPAITGKAVPQDSFWTDSNSSLYSRYKTERAQLFPNFEALNDAYWKLPKNQRRAFIEANPELSEAWAWKDEYVKENPGIQSILNYLSSTYGTEK